MNWLENIGFFVFGSGGSAILMHQLNKKRANAETDSEIVRSAKDIISEWKQLQETYKAEVEANKQEIQRLREQMKLNQDECDETNRQLKKRIDDLDATIKADKQRIKELEEKLK